MGCNYRDQMSDDEVHVTISFRQTAFDGYTKTGMTMIVQEES